MLFSVTSQLRRWVPVAVLALLPAAVVAHPIPDVPVRTWFGSDGTARFEIELDLRCFTEDPLNEPYFVYAVLQGLSEEESAELKAPAKAFLEKTARILLIGSGGPPPVENPEFSSGFGDFTIDFGKVGGGELEAADDPVALVARWETPLAEGIVGYRLEALDSGELSVLFINHLDGRRQKRMQVLFPGENSKVLDLTNIAADAIAGAAPEESADEESDAGEIDSEQETDSDGGSPTEARQGENGQKSASTDDPADGNRHTLQLVGVVLVVACLVISVLVARR